MPYRITQCSLPPGRGDVPAIVPDMWVSRERRRRERCRGTARRQQPRLPASLFSASLEQFKLKLGTVGTPVVFEAFETRGWRCVQGVINVRAVVAGMSGTLGT